MKKRVFFTTMVSIFSIMYAQLGLTSQTPIDIGTSCRFDSDCEDRGSCIPSKNEKGDTGFVGGYCTLFDCSEQNPCGLGSRCFRVGEERFTSCFLTCSSQRDCRTGYQCASEGVCLPGCSESGCPSGMKCNSEKICIEE